MRFTSGNRQCQCFGIHKADHKYLKRGRILCHTRNQTALVEVGLELCALFDFNQSATSRERWDIAHSVIT